jgi:flagellar protein FlaG
VHEDTGRSIITVTDKDSGDVIRSFPSEDVLAMAAYLAENKAQAEDAARGLLVNESA